MYEASALNHAWLVGCAGFAALRQSVQARIASPKSRYRYIPTPAAHSAPTPPTLCCSLLPLFSSSHASLFLIPQDCNTAEVGAYKALRRHPRRVSTPEAASLIYLPVFEYTSLMLGPCNGTSHTMRMQARPSYPKPPPAPPARLPRPRTAASAVRGRPSQCLIAAVCRQRPRRCSWSRPGGGRGERTTSS